MASLPLASTLKKICSGLQHMKYTTSIHMNITLYCGYLSFVYIGSRDLLLQFLPGEVHCIPGPPCRHTPAAADHERHTEHDGQRVTPDHSYGTSPLHTARRDCIERDELCALSGRNEPACWLRDQSDHSCRSDYSTGHRPG